MTKILIIGEIYGKTEDEIQHGFTGFSGIELANMLYETGLTHDTKSFYPSPQQMVNHWESVKNNHQIELTNVFNFHPPNNDLGHIFSPIKNDFMPGLKYDPKRPISYIMPEFHNHLEILWEKIKTTKPNITILLGNVAMWATLRQAKVSELRGTITSSNYLPGKYLATYNPANILRDWPNRPIVKADFIKAKRESEFPEIRRTRRKVTLNASLSEIKNWSSLPADYYSVDIESGYALYTSIELKNMTNNMRYTLSSQISMIGFARNPYDALVVEFMTRNKPNLNYWETPEEEISALNLTQSLLSKPIPKLFQNGIYDLYRLLYAGLKTTMPRNDTMLLHHSLFPEMRKSLGFLGSIYANEVAWKQMYAKGESLKSEA